MRFIKQGNYSELIDEIQAVRGKNFSTLQIENMVSGFKTISWGASCWIVKSISRQPSIPNNIYGVVLDRIDEQKRKEDKELESKTTWKAEENCLTPDEFYTGSMCISKLCKMDHSRIRLETFSEHCTKAIDAGKLLPFLKDTLVKCDEELNKCFSVKKESILDQIEVLK